MSVSIGGSHVTHNFCRVYGDSEDRVHRCRECDTAVRIQRGSAAGRDVPTPDPQESPGRHGGAAREVVEVTPVDFVRASKLYPRRESDGRSSPCSRRD
ncbi:MULTISPECIES: hypothetical protein [Haloferax]|uniref:DUF7563 family protein n=1 Tax=Haloferax TaxID=2251 RepID=UPI001CD95320|nr:MULTISPECIES: hypothetical protein [Haloferax]